MVLDCIGGPSVQSGFQVAPKNCGLKNTTISVGDVTDKGKRIEFPRKNGVHKLNAPMRPTTTRLTEAEELRKPLWLIGKRVYMVDEIGDENLVPNEIGDENLVPNGIGDEDLEPNEIGAEDPAPTDNADAEPVPRALYPNHRARGSE